MPIKHTCYSQQSKKHVISQLQSCKLIKIFTTEWNRKLFSDRSINNNIGGNKLRTYRMFKMNYQTAYYVKAKFNPKANRSVLAKVRTGIFALRVETECY